MSRILRKAQVPARNVLTTEEQALYEAVLRALYDVQRNVDVQALMDAIRGLDPALMEQAIASIRFGLTTPELTQAIYQVVQRAGIAATPNVLSVVAQTPVWQGILTGTPSVQYSFNVTDPRAMAFAQSQAANMVTAIDESMRLAIREIVFDAFKNQKTVDLTARRLRNVIGLHPRWAKAVDKQYVSVYNGLLKDGVPPARAEEKAANINEKYRQKLIRARATMIARTEIQIAQNTGRNIAFQQAVDGGWADGTSTKQWVATGPSMSGIETCEHCREMDGVRVAWNQAFPNGLLTPPAHPHCRCTMVMIPPDRGLGDDQFIATGVQPAWAPSWGQS